MSIELRVRGLRAGYGPVEVLHGVDLDVPAGQVTALIGRNGAGKTTLLRTIAGLLPAAGGTIQHGDVDITRRPAYRRARDGVLLVPDDHGVFADLTVEDNLRLFARDRELAGAPPRRSRCSAGAPARSRAPCPAANSRCWRCPGRWSARPGWCWSTS